MFDAGEPIKSRNQPSHISAHAHLSTHVLYGQKQADSFVVRYKERGIDQEWLTRSCLRRIPLRDEAEFSLQSIMNAMEKFVKTVNEMDETILVPCRLMDLKVGDSGDTVKMTTNSCKSLAGSISGVASLNVHNMASTDLYSLYAMINSVKKELLWGQKNENKEKLPTNTSSAPASLSSPAIKGHVRSPSTASLNSTNSSASISDTESDAGNENDSGIEAEDSTIQEADYPRQISENFTLHLNGLHRSLEQITEAASYLTSRYQNDIEGTV
uniref:Mid1-interacting protein n=1 Tax=Timema poppense TaxID=170557 RepID=A0A7R9GZ97_TIMPO|nr:unnamed protein product [Timema poppensis]